MRSVRVFVSSPGDTHFERMRVERVVERLNGEFSGIAQLHAIRWEGKYYQARATFQQQIPEAAECDLVVAILRHRLGTELPDDFPTMANGERYPSGTAYEILSAIEASKTKSVPDVYVFRYSEPPTVKLDDEETNRLVSDQWDRLKSFFKTWFQTQDGKFKLAFHSFQSTDQFEGEIEKLFRTWMEEKILKGRSVLWPVDTKGSPFRGLAAFGARHAPVFFGRSRDITRTVDALKDASGRGCPFMLVVGASGSGKSSLALSGLVPRLTAPGVVPSVDLWRVAVMRPGEDTAGPLAALAACLFESEEDLDEEHKGRLPALPEIAASDYPTPADLAGLFAHADATSAKPVLRALDRIAEAEAHKSGHDRSVRADLLIVVDQLDELFAGEVSDADRARFAELLSQLVATGRIWVIATLRADLYERFLKTPELLAMKTKGATYDLAPPGVTEIDEIIRGPANAAGLVYETDAKTGERLDDRLIRDVDRPDMLPLLQFALDFLFEQRQTEQGETRLTFKAYDTLGGLAGAIDQEAERALAELGKEEQERLPRLLRQLAAPAQAGEVGGGPGLSIRSAPLTETAYDPASERLVKALVDARILLSSGGEGNATIRLAHQRVLENWRRAKEIVAANAEFYRIRDDVEALRRRWEKSSRKRDLLIPKGVPLAEAESVAKRYPGELGTPALGFIAASGKRARFRQRLTAGAAVLFAVLALLSIGLTGLVTKALEQARFEAARAERNVEIATSVILDIARGLRVIEDLPAASIKKVFDQVRATVEQRSEEAPDDQQLLRMRQAMFKEFAATHRLKGDTQAAEESAAQELAIGRRLAEMTVADERQQVATRSLAPISEDASMSEETPGSSTPAEPEGGAGKEAPAPAPDEMVSSDGKDTEMIIGGSPALDPESTLPAYEKALVVARELAAAAPDDSGKQYDLTIAIEEAAANKLSAGDAVGALALYEESLAIRRRMTALANDDAKWLQNVSATLEKIGDLKFAGNDAAGALPVYEEMLAIDRKLAQADPNHADHQRNVARGLERLAKLKAGAGDSVAALALNEEALAVRQQLAQLNPGEVQPKQDASTLFERIGDLKRDSGDFAGALAAYEQMLALDRQAAAADTGNVKLQRVISIGLNRIADARLKSRDLQGALAAAEESLAVARQVALAAPDNLDWQRDVSITLERIGNIKTELGDKAGALVAYEEMLSIDRRVAEAVSGNQQREREVMISLNKVGDTKLALNDPGGAIESYEQGLAIARKIAAADPMSDQALRDISNSLEKVGAAKLAKGDAAGALVVFDESAVLREDVAKRDAQDIVRQRDWSFSIEKIGNAKSDAGDTQGARAAYERSLEITRELAQRDAANIDVQKELIVGLYKVAKLAEAARKNALIDEGLSIIDRLDAGGQLTDDQKAWRESFLTLRNGSQ